MPRPRPRPRPRPMPGKKTFIHFPFKEADKQTLVFIKLTWVNVCRQLDGLARMFR